MKKFKLLFYFTAVTAFVFLTILTGCNTRVNEKVSETDKPGSSANKENIKSIPDSVIRFLVTSAAKDFNEHKVPKAVDIRNVKAGYFSSGKDTIYLICGEFLSQENNEWVPFETIKTSGYEQNIGNIIFCKKAIFEKSDENRLSDELKRNLNELKK